MEAKEVYNFRNISFSTSMIPKRDFWSLWKFRLNPFRIKLDDHPERCVGYSAEARHIRKALFRSVCVSVIGLFRLEIWLSNNGDTYWEFYRSSNHDLYVAYWMSRDHTKIELVQDESQTSGLLQFELLGHLMPVVLLENNSLSFHGALMEHEKKGIVISAPSGIGKTTHARLWRDYRRALILNGDRATCCIEDNHWVGYSLPWSGTSGECINRDVQLTAYVILEQSEDNKAERLEGLDAFGAVMQNLLYPSWDRELTEKALDLVDAFLEKVPVFRLKCRPDLEAVEVLEAALSKL